MKSERGPPATLGSSATAGVRFIVWCKACSHQVEPNPTEQSERSAAQRGKCMLKKSTTWQSLRVSCVLAPQRPRAMNASSTNFGSAISDKRNYRSKP
jgi:hypothetical protein